LSILAVAADPRCNTRGMPAERRRGLGRPEKCRWCRSERVEPLQSPKTRPARYEFACVYCREPFIAKTPIAKCCSLKCRSGRHWANRRTRQYLCAECGKPFESKQAKASVCSGECRRARNSRISKAIAAAKFPPRPKHICQRPGCGKAFVPMRPSGAQKRGASWGKYCSQSCSAKAANTKRAQKSLPCDVCGENFVRDSKPNWRKADGRLVCSDRCAEIALAEKKARTQAAKPLKQPKQPTVRRCAECDGLFSTNRPRFCSKVCSKRYGQRVHRLKSKADRRQREVQRKRLIRSRTSVPVDPLLVFERDEWHCRLCLRPAPRSLRGTYHPQAPEMDHIVSLADGGDHSYSNTQCSCRDCNIWKGDRQVPPVYAVIRRFFLSGRIHIRHYG
jgi:hypothetical protein